MFKNVRLKQNSFKPYLQIDVKFINSRSEKITFYSFACFFLFIRSQQCSVKKIWLKVFPRRSEDSWGGQILKKRILKSIFRKRKNKKIYKRFFFLRNSWWENFFCLWKSELARHEDDEMRLSFVFSLCCRKFCCS